MRQPDSKQTEATMATREAARVAYIKGLMAYARCRDESEAAWRERVGKPPVK